MECTNNHKKSLLDNDNTEIVSVSSMISIRSVYSRKGNSNTPKKILELSKHFYYFSLVCSMNHGIISIILISISLLLLLLLALTYVVTAYSNVLLHSSDLAASTCGFVWVCNAISGIIIIITIISITTISTINPTTTITTTTTTITTTTISTTIY